MNKMLTPPEIPIVHQKVAVKASMMGQILIPFPKSDLVYYYNEVAYLEAKDNCTTIYLYNHKCFTLCGPLKSYQEELPSDIFFRCNKSFLVNIYFFREIVHNPGKVILINGADVPVSRRKLTNMLDLLKKPSNTVPSVKTTDN